MLLHRSSNPGGGLILSQPSSTFTSGTIASTKGIKSLRPLLVVTSSKSFPAFIRSLTLPIETSSFVSLAPALLDPKVKFSFC